MKVRSVQDHLVEAITTVAWVGEQIDSFQDRMSDWLTSNKRIRVVRTPSTAEFDVVEVGTSEPLPLSFSIEAGAYINVLRTSLDILVSSLCKRAGLANLEQACFPFVESRAVLDHGKYKGAKLIEGLPEPERLIIKSAQPYREGNEFLWRMHHLDNLRKHRRLLVVQVSPQMIAINSQGIAQGHIKTLSTWMEGSENFCVVALQAKDAPEYRYDVTLHIQTNEPGSVGTIPIIGLLRAFVGEVVGIIYGVDDIGSQNKPPP